MGEIAIRRSDHDAARALFEEALPLYRDAGSVLGEANCTLRLGEIAIEQSDSQTAEARFREALCLYERLPELYSIGVTYCQLAWLKPEGSEERRRHVKAAREAWESIKRPDLVELLLSDFGKEAGE